MKQYGLGKTIRILSESCYGCPNLEERYERRGVEALEIFGKGVYD